MPKPPIALVYLLTLACLPAMAQDACEPQTLLGPEGTAAAVGGALDANGQHLIIGDGGARSLCPGGGDPFACTAGAIYTFEREPDGWRSTGMVLPHDLQFGDRFGAVVALDPLNPNRMVTVTGARVVGDTRGYGHVYEFDGDSWHETARFFPHDVYTGSFFGYTLAVRGNTILVTRYPYVYRYQLVSGQWALEQILEAPPEVGEESSFGTTRITLGESWAFIAAPRDRSAGMPSSAPLHGSVLAYRRHADGSLEYVQRILAPGAPGSDGPAAQFGIDVAFDGQTLLIGASGSSPEFRDQGVAYVYELEGDAWVHRQELRSSSPGRRDRFGGGLAVDGDTMVIGHAHIGGITFRSHLFKRGPDGLWRETATIGPEYTHPVYPTGFGSRVAMHGNTAVFGAPGQDPGGAAYSFDLSCFDCQPDLDADGALTIYDFLTFLNLFDAGDMQADFDGDGELTIFDFLAFQTAFDAGCE